MSYLLEELRPPNPTIEMGELTLEFSLITLNLTVKFTALYGSLNETLDVINKDATQIFKITYAMLLDKSKFVTQKSFEKYMFSNMKNLVDVGSELTRVFHESVIASLPQLKNRKLQSEFNKAIGADETKICYGKYYDMVASRYSYTLDKFMELTLRQLVIVLDISGDSSYEELEVQAALAGRKLNPRVKALDIDEKTDAKQDADAQEMFKEKMRKFQQGIK